MVNPEFLRPGSDFARNHSIEEVGEVLIAFGNFLAAAGKTGRWGLDSVNPLLPAEQQETNRDWLIREMADLRGALDRLELTLNRSEDNAK